MSKAKLNIPMFAALILLLLTMVTTHMTSGLYARYTAAASGSDSARVAKYEITVNAASADNLVLTPAVPASYKFSITSESEVSVEYDLIITLPKKLPDSIALSLVRGDDTRTLNSASNVYTVKNAGTFSAQGGTHAYILSFTAVQPIEADELESISIRVDARQVD